MENRSPPLSPDELRQLRWLSGGVLALLAAGSAFQLDVAAGPWIALAVLAALAALVRPAAPARVPRWLHRLVFPAVAAAFTVDLWAGGEILPAMVRLALLLFAYRTFSYRRRRDDLQLVVLGLFLVVVAGVLTVSIAFAAQILAFTAGALGLLLTVTLTETGRPAPAGAGPPAWARSVRWGRLLRRVRATTDGRVVLLGAGLFAGLVALSALFFLAIPRFQLENGLWLDRFITKKAKTGFSDTIRFGDVTDILQDNAVALSVDVSDRGRIPADPYWRMLVLDEYRDGTFRLSPELRRAAFDRERTGATIRGGGRRRGGEPVTWTFYLEPGVSRYLPLPGPFGTLQFREPQNVRAAPALGLVALRDEPVAMTAYRVETRETGAALPDPEFSAREAAGAGRMLRLPDGQADRAALAAAVREIAGGAELTAMTFARQAEAWLRARHAYSLQPVVPAGAGDPLVRWLVSREGGHCELFAGSLVLLARAAGLPARVVTGFHGGSWNGYSNNFTLRNSDAHAWCEVFDAATASWRRADPTPGSGAGSAGDGAAGEAALARRLDRSWTARLDSLRVFWYRRIVSFDQRAQQETLQAAKAAAERLGDRVRAFAGRAAGTVRAWLAAPWNPGRVAKAATAGGALVAAGWILMRLGGTRADRRARTRRGGEAVRAEAGRWLERLAAAPDEEGETRELRAELQRLRFGARETWPDPPGVFHRARAWRRTARRTFTAA